MRTPQQAALAALNDGAIYAFGMGFKIQSRGLGEAEWVDFHGDAPGFTNPSIRWRVKPDAKKEIPFTRLTIPKDAIWKVRKGGPWMVIQEYGLVSVEFKGVNHLTYEIVASDLEYSRDGGETWHPGHDFIDP